MIMLTIVLRVVIIYVIVLVLYRLMGKRQLGQMQPFELVLTLIIADLATIPMAEIAVPVLHGIVPVLTLVLLHFALTFLSAKSNKFAHFLSGKPVIVINPNGVDEKALKGLNLSIDDVFEAVRGCGFFSLEQVQYAIMETNGKMSVLPKSGFAPVTNADMNLDVDESVIPVNIINEGKILKENLLIAKLKEEDVQKILKKFHFDRVKNVFLMTIDKSGKVYLQGYGKKYQTGQVKPLGQVDG